MLCTVRYCICAETIKTCTLYVYNHSGIERNKRAKEQFKLLSPVHDST